MKLNLGCGKNLLEGWTNIDSVRPDLVPATIDFRRIDLSSFDGLDLFGWSTVDEFLLSHVLEHIREPLPLLEQMWRIAKPDALCTIRVPFGSSDDAWEDPTHVRPYYAGSFGYFGQPHYWRADYGYRGDWRVERVKLVLDGNRFNADSDPGQVVAAVALERNVVREMIATLRAVKPAREARKELQEQLSIELGFES